MLRGSLLVLVFLTACAGNPDAGLFDGDGGEPREGDDCLVDGGPGDGGTCFSGVDGTECATLVEVTCGETCGESPGCAAASLLSQYEPDRCSEALADTQTYPACQLGNCGALVDRACGGDPPLEVCIDAPGCAPALDLSARASDPDASQQEIDEATASCLQALEDPIVFAPCP